MSTMDKAQRLIISIYDSTHLTLAEITATKLVTADKKFYDKAKETGRIFVLDELDQKWTI